MKFGFQESVTIKGVSYQIMAGGRRLTQKQSDSLTKQGEKRYVKVCADDNTGSGVIIQTGVVLTAYHLLGYDPEIKIGGKPAEVIHYDKKADLLLLRAQTRKLAPVVIQERYSKKSPVFYVGNPEYRTGYVSYSTIGWYDKHEICTDNLALHGFSGAGLYLLATGELIGMMCEMDGANDTGRPMACAIPSAKIIRFLKEAQVSQLAPTG